MNTQAETLARLVLDTLEKQQEYFRSRQNAALAEAKAMERRLRKAANDILHPPQEQPTLFGEQP
jgi:hypothetical protein